jgi:hypothetical protein
MKFHTLAFLVATFGCNYSDKSLGMGGGGTSQDVPDGSGDTNNSDEDTGMGNGTAPVISGVSGSWDFETDPPRALIDIQVTDAEGDIHNGKVGVSIDGSAETWFIITDPDEPGASATIEAVYNPETQEVSLVAEVDYIEGDGVMLSVRVKDAQYNTSEAYTFSPE